MAKNSRQIHNKIGAFFIHRGASLKKVCNRFSNDGEDYEEEGGIDAAYKQCNCVICKRREHKGLEPDMFRMGTNGDRCRKCAEDFGCMADNDMSDVDCECCCQDTEDGFCSPECTCDCDCHNDFYEEEAERIQGEALKLLGIQAIPTKAMRGILEDAQNPCVACVCHFFESCAPVFIVDMEEEMDALILEADLDGNGRIDYDEFSKLVSDDFITGNAKADKD